MKKWKPYDKNDEFEGLLFLLYKLGVISKEQLVKLQLRSSIYNL